MYPITKHTKLKKQNKTRPNHNQSQLEAIGIQANLENTGPNRILSSYYPPSKTFVKEDCKKIFDNDLTTILVGDQNAKHTTWGCRSTNKYGKKLLDITNELQIQIAAPTEPTHYGARTPDILDIALIKNLPKNITITSISELSSDHNPIIVEIDNLPYLQTPRIHSKTDWEKYKIYLAKIQHNIVTIEQIENTCNTITNKISEAINISTTTLPHNTTNAQLPARIKILNRKKKRLKKKAQRTLNPADKQATNRMTNTIKTELKAYNQEQWHNKIQSLTTKDNSLWKMTKALKKKPSDIPPISGPQGMVYTTEEKTEIFAETLQNQFTINKFEEDTDEEFEEEVNFAIQDLRNSPPEAPNFTASAKQIKNILTNLNKKKPRTG